MDVRGHWDRNFHRVAPGGVGETLLYHQECACAGHHQRCSSDLDLVSPSEDVISD